MTLLLVVLGVVLLAAPGALTAQLQRLGPSRWARISRNSLLAGSGLTVVGLWLWGMPAILHAADGTGIDAFCDGAVHSLPVGGVYTAAAMLVVAGVAVAGLVRAIVVAVRNLRSLRIDAFIGRHRRVAEFDVVVVPSTRLVACSVSGPDPQIVLSNGLVDQLEADQLQAVVRHEMAHHRLGHVPYLVVASAIDRLLGWVPFVRSSTRSLRDALEHWADEASTAGSPGRSECLRAALARVGSVDGTTPVRESVDRRIRHLECGGGPDGGGRPPRMYLGVALLGSAAIAGLVVASVTQLVAVVGHCPT